MLETLEDKIVIQELLVITLISSYVVWYSFSGVTYNALWTLDQQFDKYYYSHFRKEEIQA